MSDPLCIQYRAFNRRRLHYNGLFWLSLALEFSAIAIILIFNPTSWLLILGGLSCFLMSFVTLRLLRQEGHYSQCLRNIDAHWKEQGLNAIQNDLPDSRFGSRRTVIAALIVLGILLMAISTRM